MLLLTVLTGTGTGIIANVVDGGDPRDITLIRELAQSYINKENCIILLVTSCESESPEADPLLELEPTCVALLQPTLRIKGHISWRKFMIPKERVPLVSNTNPL